MNKKVLVAGAGHGGIAVAAQLASNGFNVTVIEKNSRADMGYDWTDIFDRRALSVAGIPMPEEDKYDIKGDVAFYGPSENTKFVQFSPKNQPQIRMERKEIYNLLISHAEKCGVKFIYSQNIIGPIIENDRVTGVKTKSNEFFANLIIDACGCNSPVRMGLPESFGIQRKTDKSDIFYVYRAFYDKLPTEKEPDEFKLILLSQGITGISWVSVHDEFSDMLVGRFSPFSEDEANETAEYLRKNNKVLGRSLQRGGDFAQIPVRQPLAVLVADGYAAIGDSAFMTIPLVGSGIANSFVASKFLADAIIKDEKCEFSANTLWNYQVKYYSLLGRLMAPVACIKNLLTFLSPEQIDDVFDRGMIDFSSEKAISIMQLVIRIKNVLNDKKLTSLLKKAIKNMFKVEAVIAQMPKKYSKNDVILWAQKYNRTFK